MKTITKKAFSVLLTLCLLMSMAPAAFAAGTSDINGHWAHDALQGFIDSGYLRGDGSGNYSPDGPMTRAQYAAILNRIMGLTEESAAIGSFADVPSMAWYRSDLAKALASGYMSDTSAATMSPDTAVTREQALTIIARILGLDVDNADVKVLDQFSDAGKLSDLAKKSVAAMVAAGYVQGNGGKLNPAGTLTRAEGVTVLSLVKDLLISTAKKTDSPYKDGIYTGTGAGYGGTMTVQTTIKGGKITEIKILSHSDDSVYIKAASKLIDKIVNAQTTDSIDTVSGATKSSHALLTAVGDCLSQAAGKGSGGSTGSTGGGGSGSGVIEDVDWKEGTYKDGTYEGVGRGLYAGLHVFVTISGGKITKIALGSFNEDEPYISQAKASVIPAIIAKQSPSVDTVSGATYSSKGIINAVKYALNLASATTGGTSKDALDGEIARYLQESSSAQLYDVETVSDGYLTLGVTGDKNSVSSSLIKYGPTGVKLWSYEVKGAKYSTLVSTDDGILLAGYSIEDETPNTLDDDNTSYMASAALISTNGSKLLWKKDFGSKGAYSYFGAHTYTRANYATVLNNGALVLGGTSDKASALLKAAVSGKTFTGESAGYAGFLLALDPKTGNALNGMLLDGTGADAIASIGYVKDGNLMVAGTTTSKDGFFSSATADASVFVCSLPVTADKDQTAFGGSPKWVRTIGTEDGTSWGVALGVDANQNAVVSYGQRAGGVEGAISVTKFNHDGQKMWTRDFSHDAKSFIVSSGMTERGETALTLECYDKDFKNMNGWIGLISDSGVLVWEKKHPATSENLFFNTDIAADGSLIACGEDENAKGYMEGALFKFPITYSTTSKLAGTYINSKGAGYTGVARGLNAGLHVNVTVKGNRITGITLGEHQDDEPYITSAAKGVIQKILAYQTTDVDTVSGATYSSRGIISATKYALNLASTNPAVEPAEKRDGYSLLSSYGGAAVSDGDSWFYDVEPVQGGYVATGETSVNKTPTGIIAKYDRQGTLV